MCRQASEKATLEVLELQNEEQYERAINIYQNYCAGCHGDNLEEFADQNWMFTSSPGDIEKIINEGEETMGMPAFGNAFSKEEINSLTNFILSESKKDPMDRVTYSADKYEDRSKDYWVETVVSGLNNPWGLEFLPNNNLLIADRNGKLYLFGKDKKLKEIKGLPEIRVGGQGGLMDLQLHPDYTENGWIYISFSYFDEFDKKAGNTAIIRAKLSEYNLTDIEYIYRGTPTVSTKHHYGSRIEFDNDGYLYFSIGDRGKRDKFPQLLDNSNGKVHRLHDDGRVPVDNPFIDETGADKSIYSYGHRNIQGIAKHPLTGDIWTHEHGPKGGDEINISRPGLNYGWPVISFGINYSGTKFTNDTAKAGMEQPMIYYDPSIAPCGMAFVSSTRYKGWENNLLIGSLRFKYLERLVVNENTVLEQERILEDIGRVRNVKVSPAGYIYVAVEEPGKILKLIPVSK
jgi:glucose/arabinose dehydrogenase